MAHSTLHATERRLVTLFVGGAFIFLVLFEGIFLGGRIVLENKFLKEDFERSAARLMTRISAPDSIFFRGGHTGPIDIGFVTINEKGKIIENKIGGGAEYDTIENLVDMDYISALPLGVTVSYSGYYLQKVTHPRNEALQTIFIKNGGYDIDDILRDILRFLALDIMILFPFWFLGRYFVREILQPVEANMDAMAHFIHDAGHELKTPLAIISGNLQILRDMKGKDSELIETSIATIYSMSGSLDGLVELSNLKLPKKREEINIKNSIEEIAKIYQQQLDKKNIALTLLIPEKAKVSMEGKHFSILISNILKNAIIYNKEGGSIHITFEKKTLAIHDTGIGMSPEEKEKIFDRFYRSDRTGKYPGSGIGLALVDRIVRLYGWNIHVESTKGEGTSFLLEVK